MAEKRERKNRTITANVKSFEELVTVKSSIYPWQDLVDEDGNAKGENFFVECDDMVEARGLKSSVRGSGQNYYLKRKINLVPICVAAKLKDGRVGVVCTAITPAE